MRPRLDHAREDEWLTADNTLKGEKAKTDNEITAMLKIWYILSWAQFPHHSHPPFLASQKLTERTQQ